MSIETVRVVVCDECGTRLKKTNKQVFLLNIEALKAGWSKGHTLQTRDLVHICDECRIKGPPEWWLAEVASPCNHDDDDDEDGEF